MSTAFIIGGTGQIGLAVAERLAGNGWEVKLVSRTPAPISGPWQHVTADREDRSQLRKALGDGADLILDCVAFDVRHAEQLLDLQDNVARLTVVSSASVYCDAEGRTLDEASDTGFPVFPEPISENHPTVEPGPQTYSTRKVAVERRLLNEARIPVTLLRPCAIHGPYSKHAREWWFVKRLLDGRKRIPLAYGGRSRFQTTSTQAIAEAVLFSLNSNTSQVFNVADADAPTVAEIGRAIMSAMGRHADLFGLPDAPYFPVLGATPWSVERPMVCASSVPNTKTYARAVPRAVCWLIGATRGNRRRVGKGRKNIDMKIAVLGGDGFIGWPTCLHLSRRGHDIHIIDNLSRRWIDTELGVQSLTPMDSIQERLRIWRSVAGREIRFHLIDLASEYERVKAWLAAEMPHAIIHFAEQRAAPYSMKSDRHKAYTVDNNVNATHNVLNAMVAVGLDAHLVHLGTMGVYGYSTVGSAIPEGYLPVQVELESGGTAEQEILYPANPGSIYHMTKCLDQLLFQFYAKNDGLRITDLHQGIVWGTHTEETRLHPQLINRFDYDGDYGTVLNRFIIQAAIQYPLTVHGTGGQTRAFIHIQDSVRCIELALGTPPGRGERVRIFNQMTETHRVRDLAELVSRLTGAEIAFLPNPRKEASENELVVRNAQFLAMGLSPIRLEDGLVAEVVEVAHRYAYRIDRSRIPCVSAWTAELAQNIDPNPERRRLKAV